MPWLFTQWYHSPKVSPPKGSFDQRYCLTKGIAGFSQKVSSTQCHPEQQGAAFICVAHSAQGPAVRRLCASAPARWLSRHAHSNLKHHPSVTEGGLDKATIGDRAFGKRLLSPVGSSALSKPRNVAYRVGSRVSTDGSSSPAHHTRPINTQNSSCVVVTHML